MSAVTFDPSRQIDFYFRVSRAGSKTLTFVDTLGADYSLASADFQFLIKDYFGNTILTLTEGNGLTVQNTNELVIAITVAQSNLYPAEHYWQLNRLDTNRTWLNGKAFFHNGIFDGVTETTEVVITESGDDITVTISEAAATGSGHTIQSNGSNMSTRTKLNFTNFTVADNPGSDSTDVTATKSGIGLGSVDNTSDANKPVSTATQTALNAKVSTSGDETVAGTKTFSSDPIISGSTESRVLSTDSNKKITALDTTTYPSLTELAYVKGTTSALQTQIDAKVPTTRTVNSLALSSNIIVPSSLAFRRTGGANFYSNNISVQNLTTGALAANTLRAYPFVVVVPMTLDGIRSFVTSAVGSTTYRVGIYTDSNGYPDALVANSDTGTYDSGTPASNITLTPALYWIAFNSNGAPTLRSHPLIGSMANILGLDGTATANAGSFLVGWTVALSYAAMPDPFPVGGTNILGSGVVCPVVQFRLT